jgi:ubiquinone/menaquinone biosynthesis C-methylase UbiE
MEKEQVKKEVKGYWEQEPCGSGVAHSTKYTKEYFDEIEEYRYSVEPFIPQFAQFTRQRGKKVLEVGVGAGTDHVQFARSGAELFGIDLTEAAIEMVHNRLEIEGLHSDLRRSDGEGLPFEDDSFDYVYSWGVIHHTPDTVKAAAEIYRVCKPGGKICVMIYNRHSLAAYKLWLRHGPMKMHPFRSISDVVYNHVESIGTKAYTADEARRLFYQFGDVSVTPVLTIYDTRKIPAPVAQFLPPSLGWFLVVQASK